jgi:hypothetical protein
MRILLAGNWRWPIYEEACSAAMSELGVEVVRFAWGDYFRGTVGRFQDKFPVWGPSLLRLNRDLVQAAEDVKPDVIFVWRGMHLRPRTLRLLKRNTGALLAAYNNDDPFGLRVHGQAPWHHHFCWYWYLKSIPQYDVHFAYRSVNIPELLQAGARKALLLMPYFIPQMHHPVTLSEGELREFGCDVCFAGHYEPDGRVEYIRALVKAGIHVRLFGDKYWTGSALGDLSSYFGDVRPVRGDEYAKALCGAKLCLAFLSRLNRDTYTRRCFEIPACGRLLLCERTDDLTRMFVEDKEAVFFSSVEELVEKAKRLLQNPSLAGEIAMAGQRRVWADGHDIKSRAAELLSHLEQIRDSEAGRQGQRGRKMQVSPEV